MFDEQKQEHVLDRISEGMTLSELCRREGLPRRTINRLRVDNPTFGTAFARAVDEGSEALEDRTAEIEQLVLDGKLDSQAAYTVLRNIHWRTSVRTPRKYGQKVQLDADLKMQVELIDATSAPAIAHVVAQAALPKSGEDPSA